ncbi:MAG: hypothetical protein ACTH31_16845, partial [Pseudoclavibacter sp.]
IVVPAEKVEYAPVADAEPYSPAPSGTVRLSHVDTGASVDGVDGGAHGGVAAESEWFARAELRPGAEIAGPAVIREDLSTTYVVAGQRAVVGGCGEIVITKEDA